MDRRALSTAIRMLVIGHLVVACTVAPGDVDTDTPDGTEPPAAGTLDSRPAISTVVLTPHPFADVDFSVPQVHLYVPQPQ